MSCRSNSFLRASAFHFVPSLLVMFRARAYAWLSAASSPKRTATSKWKGHTAVARVDSRAYRTTELRSSGSTDIKQTPAATTARRWDYSVGELIQLFGNNPARRRRAARGLHLRRCLPHTPMGRSLFYSRGSVFLACRVQSCELLMHVKTRLVIRRLSEGHKFTQSRGGACTGIFSFQQTGR